MYILFDFFASAWGVIRSFILFIDSVGLTFIDNAYSLLVSAAAGFEGDVVKEIAENIAKNVYIIIGIFALFRIAVILINTIINPDKLTDKESGFGNVLARFVITICLFVAVPFIFDMSREIQAEIMKNNYISKAIIGTDLTSGNPGQVLKDTAVRALIHPDERVANKNSDNKYTCINDNDPCKTAVESWNNDAGITTLTRFIGDYEEVDGENVYIYDYIPFVTLLVGGFMTYVLFSFAIDIAVRSVELLALEVLAPLFIVTYIDPKSSSSGPFKNWVKTCSKTFISLFIKIGIVCLMLLFMQNLSTLMGSMNSDNGAFLNLLMMIAILIFAKKAPKWIGDMIGVEGGLGGLGIGKKLGGAALVGGALSKGLESAKKFTGQKAKNFGANRLRNTAARIGGMKEAHAQNRANKKALTNDGKLDRDAYKNSKQSLWKQGRAAAKESRQANWGKDAQGLLKDIGGGFMSGRLNVNPEAKSLNAKMKDNAEKSALKYNEKVGNSDAERALRAERAANKKEAKRLYNDVAVDPITGDRLKVKNAKGESVYVNPRGPKEMNAAFGNPKTEFEAYGAYGANLALSKGFTIQNDRVIDTNGKDLGSVQEYGISNMSYAGQLAVKSLVSDNVKDTVTRYTDSKQQAVKASQDYSQAVIQYNQAVSSFKNDPNVQKAASVIAKYEAVKNDPKFVELANKDRSTLTQEEQVELSGYLIELDSMQKDYKNAQSEYDASFKSYGIEQISTNLGEAQKRVKAWSEEVKKLEKQISETSAPAYDDSGKVKTDSSGNIVMENPYTVEINGEKLSPVDNFVRINEIQNMLSIKASKAKSKYDDAMKEPDSSK